MNDPPPPRGGFFAGLWAMLRLRCPRCRQGRVFRSLLQMNDPCPVCGLLFQREEGYFLGAMYVSYAIGSVLIGTAFFIAWALWPEAPALLLCLLLFAGYVPFMPWVYRYSRVIWMHLDYLVNPGESAAGSYEKMRKHQQAQAERK
jgi:uncharacterized protein (DUF983 family)